MSVSRQLKNAISESGKTHYRIWKDCGVDSRVLDRFMADDADIRASTIDALCEYFGLELRPKKGETERKDASKKAATKRKGRKKTGE